jgi:hypothetical protein
VFTRSTTGPCPEPGSQVNPVHTIIICFFKIHFIVVILLLLLLLLLLSVGLPCCLVPSGFLTRILSKTIIKAEYNKIEMGKSFRRK